MPTGRPTREYDRPRNTVRAGLRGEPVKRRSQLFRDLRQARVRGQSVARQRRRPAARENTLSHTSKYLLTAALPITAMNVNVAGRLRISGGIQVPLGPICLSISQIEVLRALRAESLRGCSPPFGFLSSEFGSHMCHIIKRQVAFLQRHDHPGHTFRDDSFCGTNCGGYNTSGGHSHESATVKNDHDRPPCIYPWASPARLLNTGKVPWQGDAAPLILALDCA